MKQKLVELPGKTDRFTISIGNFNLQYSYYLIEQVDRKLVVSWKTLKYYQPT